MLYLDEFDSMFDDWMYEEDVNIEPFSAVKDLMSIVSAKFSHSLSNGENEQYDHFISKALAAQQKLIMMFYAKQKALEARSSFESTQNMDFPSLYGLGKTALLFYLESIIVFARNSLDVIATIYGFWVYHKRFDSFNKFSKKILNESNPTLSSLKEFYTNLANDELSSFRLLCGNEKGRALRDIIIHQANINLQYMEYMENREKEKLFILINGIEPIEFDFFVEFFPRDVLTLIDKTTNFLKNCSSSD